MLFFFLNETATTEIYTYGHTLSLHDALPIYQMRRERARQRIMPAAVGEREIDHARIARGRHRAAAPQRPASVARHRQRQRMPDAAQPREQIGRASGRERVGKNVEILVVAESLKKKKRDKNKRKQKQTK